MDPYGLYLVIFYDVQTGRIRAWDIKPNEDYGTRIKSKPDFEYGGAFSGSGECQNKSSCELRKDSGPIPKGNYAIDGSVNSGDRRGGFRAYSFKLYRQTSGAFLDTNGLYSHEETPIGNGVTRSGFYLHPGTISIGCITIPEADRAIYDQLRTLLENTSKSSFYESGRLYSSKRVGSGFVYVY